MTTTTPSSTPPEPTPPANSHRWDRLGVVMAWTAILISVAAIAWAVQRATLLREEAIRQAEATGGPSPANPQQALSAKYAVGIAELMRSQGMPAPPNLAGEVLASARTPADRLALIPVVGEVAGKDAALAALNNVAPAPASTQPATTAATAPAIPPAAPLPLSEPPVAAALRDLYSNGSEQLSADQRSLLVDRLGWTGKLALTFDNPDHPDRQALLEGATRFAILFVTLMLAALLGVVAGIILLIIAIVLLAQGTLRPRYSAGAAPGETDAAVRPASSNALRPGELPAPWSAYGGTIGTGPSGPGSISSPPPADVPPPGVPYALPTTAPGRPVGGLGPVGAANGRTGPFLEAFAIYLAGQVAVSVIRNFLDDPGIGWNFVVLAPVLLALLWPRLRGVRGAELRRGFGWTAPRGVLRELGSGIVGYVAGLPVFLLGLIIVLLLVNLTNATPTHPIVHEAGQGGVWQTLLLFGLAAVWAPVVEELFFRGALFHHLRTRWGWLISALLSSFIFAVVHPQGWTLVPGLMSLAIVFCAIREWRGSTLGGMMAHALHNGAIVTLLVLAAG